MQYKDLDINGRINLKGTLIAFQKYAIADWQRELDKKLYRKKTPKSGRTRALRTQWGSTLIQTVTGVSTLRFTFPLYGRFVDMGVGKGTSFVDQQYARTRFGRRIGDAPPRKAVRWYAKKKGYNQHRLSEIMVKRYGLGMVNFVENSLTFTVGINL